MLAFGPADLGEVDFARLERPGSPNAALACRPEACPGASFEIETPVYPVSGARLREIVREAIAARPNAEPVYAARWEEADRFVERSALMRFPDTVNAQVFGAGPGRSMLALYSRSQIGYSDLGVNRARIDAILADVAASVAREPQP